MKLTVGVSDIKVSRKAEDLIITHALGSCLGITLYDKVAKVGGMLHVMLPLSKKDPMKAQLKPAMYVDTGLNILFNMVYSMGATKENLEINVAGGSSMKKNADDDYFKIGQRNFTTFRKLIWKNGFMIANQDVGGSISRTMTLSIADGTVMVNNEVLNKPKMIRQPERQSRSAMAATRLG